MQWFRFYADALNDPKVQSMDGDSFKAWVNLLCVTLQCNGEVVTGDVAFYLRVTEPQAAFLVIPERLA